MVLFLFSILKNILLFLSAHRCKKTKNYGPAPSPSTAYCAPGGAGRHYNLVIVSLKLVNRKSLKIIQTHK